jgi:hypothetical protein
LRTRAVADRATAGSRGMARVVRGYVAVAVSVDRGRRRLLEKAMPDKNAIHTVPSDSGWINTREGSSKRLGDAHRTQAEAVRAGRERARAANVEHLIHGRDGKIRSRNSYGNDPAPPAG